MNRKTLFEIMNLNLNYLREIIKDRFEENYIKNMIYNRMFKFYNKIRLTKSRNVNNWS